MIAFTYYSISSLINFLFSLLATLTLFVPDKKNMIEKNVVNAFLRFAFFVVFWAGYYFLWQTSGTYDGALFNAKVFTSFIAFIPVAYLDYSLTLLGLHNKKTRWFIVLSYLASMFFVFGGLVATVSPKLSFLFWPDGTDLFSIFILFWLFIFLLSLVVLIYGLRDKNKALDKRYVLLSITASIFGIFGFMSNFFLWFDIAIPPLGNIFVSVFFFMTVYIVRRYNVSNLRLFYIQLPALLISMFAFARILVSGTNFDLYTNILFFFVMTVAFIYIVASSDEQEKNQIILENAVKSMRNANEKLVEIDKHKSDFVSIAAHQLRTPSGIIRSYAEMMGSGMFGDIPPKLKEPVMRILENGTLLTETISTILNISHIENGRVLDLEKVDVSELLQNNIAQFEVNAKKKNLIFTYTTEVKGNYMISADSEKVRNALVNVIDNAIKYTDEGSVAVRLYEEGESVCIEIKDTGRGMSKKFMETQLYQKFAREESITKNISGNGLGMYFVKEVVDLHNGVITVDSKENKGTVLTIILPKKQPLKKKVAKKQTKQSLKATKVVGMPDF